MKYLLVLYAYASFAQDTPIIVVFDTMPQCMAALRVVKKEVLPAKGIQCHEVAP